MDIEARPLVNKILTSEWTITEPSTRPRQMTPSIPNCKYKYTVENCLPSFLHNTKSRSSCTPKEPWSQGLSAPYPSTQSYAAMIHQQFSKQHSIPNDGIPIIQPQATASLETGISSTGEGNGSLLNSNSITTKEQHKRASVSKIGAVGRKIADAMKSKSQKRGMSISGVPSDQAKTSQ